MKRIVASLTVLILTSLAATAVAQEVRFDQRAIVVNPSPTFNVTTFVDKDGHYVTKQPEYETVWAHGGNCGICDLDAIAKENKRLRERVDTLEQTGKAPAGSRRRGGGTRSRRTRG